MDFDRPEQRTGEDYALDRPVATIPGVEPLSSSASTEHADHGAGEPHEEEEHPNPVGDILKVADLLHGGYEGIVNGGMTMGALGKESAHLVEHGSHAAAQGTAALLGPLAFAGSTVETIMGVHEAATSKTSEGIGKGSVDATAGVSGMFGSANTMLAAAGGGGSFSAAAGPAAAAGELGLMFGHYGDEQAKQQHRFGRGSDGQYRSGSDWAADKALDANAAVSDFTGSRTLGKWAGGAVALGEGVAAAPKAVKAGAIGIGHAIEGEASKISRGADHLFDWLVGD